MIQLDLRLLCLQLDVDITVEGSEHIEHPHFQVACLQPS